jgi:excisionase family DNA binding protein
LGSTDEAASRATASTAGTTPHNILHALRSVRHEMSVKEVAELLGRSIDTVYRMVRRNEIPHLVLAGSLRFDPSVLELWLIQKEPLLAVVARRFAPVA